MDSEQNPELVKRRGVVAMLDALGTKGAWARGNPQEFVQRWQTVLGLFRDWAHIAQTDPQYLPICRRCRVFAFSDTVIVTLESAQSDPAQSNYREELGLMCSILLPSFVEAFLNGIVFRGVVAAGEFYQTADEELISRPDFDVLTIGPVIDEAAEWHNKSDWIGISLVPSACFHIERQRLIGDFEPDLLTEYAVPQRNSGSLLAWALNWPQEMIELLGGRSEVRAAIVDTFSRHPIPSEALSKYVNTLSFFDLVAPAT